MHRSAPHQFVGHTLLVCKFFAWHIFRNYFIVGSNEGGDDKRWFCDFWRIAIGNWSRMVRPRIIDVDDDYPSLNSHAYAKYFSMQNLMHFHITCKYDWNGQWAWMNVAKNFFFRNLEGHTFSYFKININVFATAIFLLVYICDNSNILAILFLTSCEKWSGKCRRCDGLAFSLWIYGSSTSGKIRTESRCQLSLRTRIS